jgi:hypothetical protein
MTDSPSPTFIARFADGETTRMTVWHSPERKSFDLGRAIRLAHHAYRTRVHNLERRTDFDGAPVAVPPIKSAWFERNGKVLAEYDAKQIADERRCHGLDQAQAGHHHRGPRRLKKTNPANLGSGRVRVSTFFPKGNSP